MFWIMLAFASTPIFMIVLFGCMAFAAWREDHQRERRARKTRRQAAGWRLSRLQAYNAGWNAGYAAGMAASQPAADHADIRRAMEFGSDTDWLEDESYYQPAADADSRHAPAIAPPYGSNAHSPGSD
jgi:hypothetical protein